MIEIGKKQKLIVAKTVDFGVYLAEDKNAGQEDRVLLPAKQVPEGTREGDALDAFIYKDSRDRLIATTREPLLQVGQTAVLKVLQVTKIGAFLDWGLEKDLLLPYHEQTSRVREGQECLVALYVDKSSRLCATMKVYHYLSTRTPYVTGDSVKGRVYEISDRFGVFVAVDDKYSALIPAREASGKYRPGEVLDLRVSEVKEDGKIQEKVWKVGGLYGQALEKIVYWLKKAEGVAETPEQKAVIAKLMEFYETGDLKTFDEYAILWVKDLNSRIDFVNGFTESYGDPLGMKASWESLVNFKDLEATQRTELISGNAQWFEDHSPVDGQFKKEKVKGVSAKVITAAILAGDLYPATAIGINLPNANWIRSHHGSKSVTIGNITDAYNKAAHGNGFNEEFVYSDAELQLIDKYADVTDELHTDLHECLGHGSGKLLPGVDPDALKAYGSTIEEARADLFGLYYVADPKLVELGLTPSADAYKAQYYTYLMNGLMTQLVRIEPGNNVEEAHMRNRQLIARWVYEKGAAEKVVELVKKDGKTYVVINDYEKVRDLFGRLLAEIQRIKSTGDYAGAHDLVEAYAVKVDPALHAEVLERYKKLNLAPYKGFVNPKYEVVTDADGTITDVTVTYDEGYAEQMLRYSKDYSTLSSVNK